MMSSSAMAWLAWMLNVTLVLVLWALSVVAIVAAVRASGGGRGPRHGDPAQRRGLDEGVARPEADAQEPLDRRDLVHSGN